MVVPKKEENKIFDLSKEEYNDLMNFSYRVAKALEKDLFKSNKNNDSLIQDEDIFI